MSETKNPGFSAEEKAAMKERAKELRAEARAGAKRADSEKSVLDTIAAMPEADRVIAEKIHQVAAEIAPELLPKLMYGMPSYARDKDVLFFFQAASKFSTRYATFGFNDGAKLDDGAMWATGFGISELTPEVERRIVELITRAIG